MARVPLTIDLADPTTGLAVPGATVTVKTTSGANAALYAARTGGGTSANPLTTDSTGLASCWVDRGLYRLVFAGGVTRPDEWWAAPATDDDEIDLAWFGPLGATGLVRAYHNTAVNLSSGDVVEWDHEDFDVSSWFDTTTGRLTPPVACYLHLTTFVTANVALTAGNYWIAEIRKNGAIELPGTTTFQGSSGTTPTSMASGPVKADGVSDYFDVVVSHNQGSAVALDITRTHSFFSGHLIGLQ